MKKLLVPFFVYVTFAMLVVFFVGFCLLPLPQLPQGAEISYKISNGLSVLFDVVPSICFTGFLLGCSLAFGESSAKSTARFSVATMKLFKKIIFIAIAITLLISLCTLVFLPYQHSKQQGLKNLSGILNEYTKLSYKYLNADLPDQALIYIERAMRLDSKNEQIQSLSRKAELALKEQESAKSKEKSLSYAQTNLNAQKRLPAFFDESKMSVEDMMLKSEENFKDRDFLGAHYFASNVMRLSSFDTEIYAKAKAMADKSWNELQTVRMEEESAENIFFRKKLTGYTLLMAGNYVDAYYIFHSLSQEDARKERDPDVIRYLDVAENRLLENYFFIDETEDLTTFETANNVYFTIPQEYGRYDVVLIQGVTEVEGTGGLVRYLRDVKIYTFDAGGHLLYYMETPYAKMSAIKTSTLDETNRLIYAPDPSTKMIPQIMLCSLGRFSSEEKKPPQYFIADGAKSHLFDASEKPNKIYWPMPYGDFSLIVDSFFGQGTLTSVWKGKFAAAAPSYGFSHEGFSFSALNKIFYPFMILILLIFIAVIAWNYRLEKGVLFKFKWILVLPTLNVVFYFVRRAVEYIASLMNFVFIATVGTNFVFLIGIAVYLILLIIMILTFLARKGD